ncbi:ABC transporter permease, partial [bacterium]|nr:ABC transporter permease [bacterium]
MFKSNSRWFGLGMQALAVALALLFTSVVLSAANAQPFEAYKNIVLGSVGSFKKFSDVLVAWIPLLLATSGLLITFSAGLWNIGIEGQITMGAIFTTGAIRLLQDTAVSPVVILILGFVAGMVGGALWASLVGLLKIYGSVNEIFGGLGLNFIATAFTTWLIFGPWKRPGVGSMSGTEPFDTTLWLPTISGLRLSIWSLALGIVVILLVFFLLQGTYFGLRLKAVGKNIRSAFLLGIPTTRY